MQGLSDAIEQLPGTVFAVLNGAWFDNLPALLNEVDLSRLSLFRAEQDIELQRSGPWLVEVDTPNRRDRVSRILSLIGDKPGSVFWSCRLGQEALYRHLRSLNEVEVPNRSGDVEGRSYSSETKTATSRHAYNRVLFRHWDPRVLASVALLVEEVQAARLLGPAAGVAMNAGYGRGAVTITPPPGLPDAHHGPLRFTVAQIEALTDEHLDRHRGETMAYLRAHCREETIGLNDRSLNRIILEAERNAQDLGLIGGDDLIMFAWLWLATHSNHTGGTELRSLLTDRVYGSTPSSRLSTLWTALDEAGFQPRQR